MKVFIITQGEYSDYGIRAVSLDKDDAERKCALLNRNERYGEYCEIEEYDTEDMVVETNEEVKKKFYMSMKCDEDKVMWFEESYLTFEDENRAWLTKGCCENIVRCIATLPSNTTEEQAKKIMFDRVPKFKAERAGL